MSEATGHRVPRSRRLLRRLSRRLLPPRWLGLPLFRSALGVRSEHGHVVSQVGDLVLEYSLNSVIGQLLFLEGDFEPGEAAFIADRLRRRDGAIFVDVGANIGLHSLRAAALPGVACVHAFEPGLATYAMLERNLRRNAGGGKVVASRAAVAARSGEATFHFCADDAYSSLVPDNRRPVQESYTVPVVSFDDWSDTARLPRIDLVKIDVEGAEPDVIRGAERTFRDYRPELVVEVYQGTRAGFSAEELVARICQLGFAAFVLVDGRPVPFTAHDDRYFNYHFVPTSSGA